MLSLDLANRLAFRTRAEGRRLNLAPLAVAVLDAGGNLVSFMREDKAGIGRFHLAFAKAWGSLGMGFGSRELANRAAKNPVFVAALVDVTGGRAAPSPGGLLLLDADGGVIGAIGVSGDLGDQDERCAIIAIEDAGLRYSA